MVSRGDQVARWTGALLALFLLSSCASRVVVNCPEGTQPLPDCPPLEAVDDAFINEIYDQRTYVPPGDVTEDPVETGRDFKTPIQQAYAKILGPSEEDALDSLAGKIWMVENAQHTVDVLYYIYKRDLIGYALLGAIVGEGGLISADLIVIALVVGASNAVLAPIAAPIMAWALAAEVDRR